MKVTKTSLNRLMLFRKMESPDSKTPGVEYFYQYPYPRNTNFYGREAEIQAIRSLLSHTTEVKEEQRIVIDGLGGVGKTELVLEYAYRYRTSYKVVLWIDCALRTTMAHSLAKGAGGLGLDHENSRISTMYSDVIKYLDQSSKIVSQAGIVSVLIGRF